MLAMQACFPSLKCWLIANNTYKTDKTNKVDKTNKADKTDRTDKTDKS